MKLQLQHDFSGDHWIEHLTKDEAYDIADRIEKYLREDESLSCKFIARACKMIDSWSVYLRYRTKCAGFYSYADLYIRMREYDSQLKRILNQAGIKPEEDP